VEEGWLSLRAAAKLDLASGTETLMFAAMVGRIPGF
jgi:hypothetical protein